MNPSYRCWPFCNETVQSVLEPHLDIFLHFYLVHEQLKIVNKIERNCLSTWMSKMCLDTIYVWILTKDHLLDGACPISNQMNVLTHLGKTWKLISKGSIFSKPIISPDTKSNPGASNWPELKIANKNLWNICWRINMKLVIHILYLAPGLCCLHTTSNNQSIVSWIF